MLTALLFAYAFGCGFNLAWCLYDYQKNPTRWSERTLQLSAVYVLLWTIGSLPAFLFDALELQDMFE
jgi:uncharacterized membrane protein SpoIIM required for sporulation